VLPGPAAISIRGLTKRYGKLIAVDRIDLEVRRGEVFGFLGLNGAGKTTTIESYSTCCAPPRAMLLSSGMIASQTA
jgi:ABC-type multidrug transport system ATPase subunit